MKKWITLLLLSIVMAVMVGCGPVKYIPVETVKIEHKDRYVKDSTFFRDTVHIYMRGDTIFNDVTKWRERWLIDTLRIHKVDTINTIVEVVAPLTKWQSLRIRWFNYIFGLSVALIAILLLKFLVFKK